MQLRRVLASVAAAALAAHGRAETVTPVQKVLQLMDSMLAKGKQEKHAEQVQFAAYKQFCDDTSVEKRRAIDEANEKIGLLQADIEKYTANAEKLTKEIAQHDADIATWNGDKDAATKVRTIEKADFDAMHKDYAESISALQRAIAVLKKQAYDRKQAEAVPVQPAAAQSSAAAAAADASAAVVDTAAPAAAPSPAAAMSPAPAPAALVEVAAVTRLSLLPESAKESIEALLQAAPEAYGYEFQSHGVIDLLEKLLNEFAEEQTKLEKGERNAKHAYEMLIQDLTAQTQQATSDREAKTEQKAKNLQAKADAEGDEGHHRDPRR